MRQLLPGYALTVNVLYHNSYCNETLHVTYFIIYEFGFQSRIRRCMLIFYKDSPLGGVGRFLQLGVTIFSSRSVLPSTNYNEIHLKRLPGTHCFHYIKP